MENPARQIWVSTSFETDLPFESAYLHFSKHCFEQLAPDLLSSKIDPMQVIKRVKGNTGEICVLSRIFKDLAKQDG